MSSLYHEYLVEDREFTSFEDFKKHCRLKTKPDFNFAYDIVDKYATDFPGKRALVWINDEGEEKTFTFDDISRESKRAAYWLASKGIKKAAENYLNGSMVEVDESTLQTKEIKIKTIENYVIEGTTYFYITDDDNKKYKVSIKTDENLPFINPGDKLKIGYSKENNITEISKIIYK